jgi:hypothetical protein
MRLLKFYLLQGEPDGRTVFCVRTSSVPGYCRLGLAGFHYQHFISGNKNRTISLTSHINNTNITDTTTAIAPHCNKKSIYVFQKRNCVASVPISTFMCLWAIYIFPGSVHIFSCSRIGRPIEGIYKSLTYTWMWKLGLRPTNFFFMNICFKFFVFWCLCCASTATTTYANTYTATTHLIPTTPATAAILIPLPPPPTPQQ